MFFLAQRKLLIGAAAAAALTVAAAQVKPTLLITGKIAANAPVKLTYDDLAELPQHSFTTRSPWAKESHTYAGPLLRDVLAKVRADGTTIKAVALNDYQVLIPASDARQWNVIVALTIDGKAIPVRDKGPFFVVYPYDSDLRLQSAEIYARSIWQLKAIKVE